MFKEFLDTIFKLPPIEKRRDIKRARIKFAPISTQEKDDAYIYHECGMASFILCMILTVLFLVVLYTRQELNLYFLRIAIPKVPDEKFIEAFFKQYSNVTSHIIWWAIVPFYMIRFLWNINPKRYDLLWAAPGFQARSQRKRLRIFINSLGLMLVGVVLIEGSYGIIALFAGGLYPQTPILYLGTILAFLSYTAGISTVIMVHGGMCLYRYIGQYEPMGIEKRNVDRER